MHFIPIDSSEGSNYLASVRQSGNVVALVGSGISIWHPSNMPNGQGITNALADVIADTTVSPRSIVIERIRNSAFEHIMERYPKREVLRQIVTKAFYPTLPNPVHEAYARLLEEGIVQHIITTNYDVGLEVACSAICSQQRMPQIVIAEDDLSAIDVIRPVLFKIHGCASPGNIDSVVLTLGGEGEMPQWKRGLLEQLINDKHLLVCGYSGLDFEISPELMRLAPSATAWNSFQDPRTDENALTSNARRVLEATQGTTLIGDMNQMLKALTQQDWDAKFSKVSPDFVSQLVAALDSWELDKWRVWVLNGLSCALDGVQVARRMYENRGSSKERELDSLLALAEPLFHSGQYKQAGKTYRKAAQLASGGKDWDRIVKAEIGVVESDRVAGYWLRARRRIRKLERTLPRQAPPEEREKVINEIKLKRILLRRYPFRLFKILRLRPLYERIRNKAKEELKQSTAFFAREGSWFNLQHCEMLAGKFDIKFSEIYSGSLIPLSAREGYRHLGYITAEIMAYRAMLKDSTIHDPPLNVEYMKIAQELGVYPEVWKLGRAIENRFGRIVLPSSADGTKSWSRKQTLVSLPMPMFFYYPAREAWRLCEYTPTMRLLLQWLGEET